MSTPPTRPTPALMARRRPTPPAAAPRPTRSSASTKPVSAADAVAPGQLGPREVMRQVYQQAIRISRMRPESRLVALTLLSYSNFRTGLLSKREPDTEQLAYATGLTQAQVVVHLEILTQRGWLTRRTIATGPRVGQSASQLCVPVYVLQQLRDRGEPDA